MLYGDTMKVHLKKLCVAVDSVHALTEIMRLRAQQGERYVCAYTTHKPKQADALIESGSLYWIIKGKISARQKIVDFESYVDDTDRKRTKIILDKTVIATELYAHGPFQGWRYLKQDDTPSDIDTQKYAHIDSEYLEQLDALGIL